jgi:hypothetical protein
MRLTDCADTETMFRVIQSIPSPKVEPLKRWLARVGKERIDEIENPEFSMERMQLLYEKKGYPKEWIDKRMRGIAVRQDLTGEWRNRGARTSLEYAILTNEIMQGAFALQAKEEITGVIAWQDIENSGAGCPDRCGMVPHRGTKRSGRWAIN